MKIALLGNPNTGKTSVFNLLTGLRQHTGNFPGVTVEKKSGNFIIDKQTVQLIDFPGTYSLYPRSEDEKIVADVLLNPKHVDFPNICVVVLDASNLRRNLFLFSQIYDLEIPTVLILNMIDIVDKQGLEVSIEQLQKYFPNVSITTCNARIKIGKERIIKAIQSVKYRVEENEFKPFLKNVLNKTINDKQLQEIEAQQRFEKIDAIIPTIIREKIKQETQNTLKTQNWSTKIDKILTHRIGGYFIFGFILLLIFQLIFSFATIPMDFIEEQFGNLADWTANILPEGIFNDLISKGVLPGIGGVVIFIPQIAILFFFIAILEETGYMARVVFIMDKLMRPFGLNGKSVVPMISGVACAIPAVMSARTIANWKERMITIFVTPLMSCSARIPVYTLLIALVIPPTKILGLNIQGLVLLGLYLLGLFTALGTAALLKIMVKTKNRGFLLLEMPSYKSPRWANVGITVVEKTKVFIIDAGKIILAISIILWALAEYGPKNNMKEAVEKTLQSSEYKLLTEEKQAEKIASIQLENSYIGIMGKTIEPIIKPLGYDWKIGIALITSFAAREVFVGSLATIYSVHDDGEENIPLRQKLLKEKHRDQTPVYTLATGVSLMVFYVFAMQCMATMAVVKRETGSWKWVFLQLGIFGIFAYFGGFISFNLLS